jgi:hypothetical protein
MKHFVFYTNRFIPRRFAAHTRGPVIFIRPEYRDDHGLLEHEIVHVRQWYRNPLFGLFYKFSARFRLNAEVEAYRKQLKSSPNNRDLFAHYIASKYNLDITQEQAAKLLD